MTFPFYNVLGYPSVWCPDLYRTVISIEHLASAGLWCSLGLILKIFLKFRKFQPRYSYTEINLYIYI